jgi:hypothetical protein
VALLVLALAVGAGALGCGKRSATVSGQVTYKGKPVTSGTVVFFGADGQPCPPASVQEDGTYKATKVATGPVKVVLDNPPPLRYGWNRKMSKELANDPEIQQANRQAKNYVPTPPKYGDVKQSGLTAELTGGSNNYNIELK